MRRAWFLLLVVALAPLIVWGKAIDLTGVTTCQDVDALPAYSSGETWASLFEVIAPYQSLCRVAAPANYTSRKPWPACLWELPASNIPKAIEWEKSQIKSSQSWLKMSGDTVQLPRAGGSLAASKFLAMLPRELDMSTIKTVLDEGAGVCGLAAEIMLTYPHRPLVLSYAPHDTHTNQVQLCMERGVPAIIFSMARYQFPVPPGSFDMVTCKWCWHWIGAVSIGQWFFEVDRVLRPGGVFVIFAAVWKNHNFKEQVEHWSKALAWQKIRGSGKDMAVYRKPDLMIDGSAQAGFTVCPPAEAEQPSFRRFHVPCRHVTPQPPAVPNGVVDEELAYLRQLLPHMPNSSSFVNVLDVNAGVGAFGNAVRALMPSAWTFNIQPVHSVEFHHASSKEGGRSVNYAGMSNFVQAVGPDGLPAVFAQGQIGLYHDWCYMFPSYPRSFDFIHVRHLDIQSHGTCLPQVFLELDRLLRPGGYIVVSGSFTGLMTANVVQPLGWQAVQQLPNVQSQGHTLLMRKLGGAFTESPQ